MPKQTLNENSQTRFVRTFAGAVQMFVLLACLVIPTQLFGAFGIVTNSNNYQIDTGAGLVFKIRTDNPSSTTSPGDIMSLVYNGVEYQDQTRGSQINSGFDWIYNYTNLVSVTPTVYGTNYIKITVVCGDPSNSGNGLLTHYYIARNGYPYIYMATYFNKEPEAQALCRYIIRSFYNLLPNGPPPSDLNGNTGAVESGDIFGMPDGTTRSKHYSNHRLIDWSYTGATNSGVGLWMVRESGEGSSGGPFFRCLINQGDGVNSDQEIYEISNYGEAQTEAYRVNILDGPYTLVFTGGGAPPVPLDYSWLQTAGLNLVGFVPDSGRGAVAGTVSGIPAGFQTVVGFSNTNAEYWTIADTNGNYASPLMIPGTYTASLYKQELVVATATATVTAGTTNTLNLASTEITPSYVFKIGEWDGTPAGFLNADKMTYMHPSDSRMSNWGMGSNVFNVGTDPISIFPAITMRGTNTHCYINFNLTSGQVTNLTLRIGATTGYNGGRPDVKINGFDRSFPAAPSQPKTRTWTIGSYRGNNITWTWTLPSADLVVGQNQLDISPVSGSADSSPWLSAGWVYDAVELDGPSSAPQPPSAPTGLTATAGNAQVALSWTASSGATSYNVKRATVSGGPYTTIASPTTTSYTDTTAVNGTTYFYVVTAVNANGESANSNEAGATPQAPPAAPTGLTATGVSASQINLSWTASSGATSYNVKRATVSGGPYTTLATGVAATTYSDATAASGTTYFYVVSAVNTAGESANSTEANGTTIPAAPTGLTATAGNAQVTLSWSASTGTTSYNVKRTTVSGGPYTTIATGVATASYTDSTVANGTTYFYVVSAVNGSGESVNSTEVSATPSAPAPPPAPMGLAATAGNNQVALNWTASTGATSYNVKRATVSGGPYTTVATGVTATSYTDSTAANGTTYYYVVSAVNANGESANSAEVSATPSAPSVPAAPTGLTATGAKRKVSLTWNASGGATSYNVKRATVNGGPYTTVATGVTLTSYTDTGLTSGTTYYYVVSAVNGAGESPNSTQASATAR